MSFRVNMQRSKIWWLSKFIKTHGLSLDPRYAERQKGRTEEGGEKFGVQEQTLFKRWIQEFEKLVKRI